MKMYATLAAFAAAGSLTLAAQASTILAEWTFETSIPDTAGPHAAEGGLFGGNASAFHASGSVVYSNPVGNGSQESFSSNNWSIGDYYQFQTSTLGFSNIAVQWDQTRSGTGPGTFMLQWSTDGVNFTDALEYDVAQISWSSINYNPASTFGAILLPSDLDNQASIWIRMTNLVDPGGASGSNRIDNVIISSIPAPGAIALLGLAGLAGTSRRRRV